MPELSFRFPDVSDAQWQVFLHILDQPQRLPLGSTCINGIDVGDAYFQMVFRHQHSKSRDDVYSFHLIPAFPRYGKVEAIQPFSAEELGECVNTYLPCDQLTGEKGLTFPLSALAVSTYADLCKLLKDHILAFLQVPQESEAFERLLLATQKDTGFFAKRDAVLRGTFQREHIQVDPHIHEEATVTFLLSGRKRDGHAVSFSIPEEKKDVLVAFFSDQGWTLELLADEDQFSASSPNGSLTYQSGTVQGTLQDDILLPFLLALTETLPDVPLTLTQKNPTVTLSDGDFSTLCNQHAKTLDGYLQAMVKKGETRHPADAVVPFLRITDQYFSTKQEGKRLHAFLAQEVYTMVRSGYLQEESGQFFVGKPVPMES